MSNLGASGRSASSVPNERVGLAIIILNYKTPDFVRDCLQSLEGEITDDVRVIVVDNASNDGSAAKIREVIATRGYDGWARVLESPANRGFAAGNNFGIRAIDAEAYLLLNSDTIVRPGALAALRRALVTYRDAGLVVPRTEGLDGRPDRNAFVMPRPISELLRGARLGALSHVLHRFDVEAELPESSLLEPDWVGFCAVVVPRATLERVGLLDEQYFMYYEDIDYCIRVREAGFTIRVCPEARIVHLLGGSSGFSSSDGNQKRAARFFYESRARFFAKHYGIGGLLAANTGFTIGRALSHVREVLSKKHRGHREHELQDVWINMLTPFRPYTAPGGNR